MKKRISYLMGILLTITGALVGCSEEDTSYAELSTDIQALSLEIEGESIIKIIDGNGNYKVASSDENVATVTLEGNAVKVKGLKRGHATIIIQDWAHKSKEVSVNVNQLVDLILENPSIKMEVEKTTFINIYSGNDNYSLTVQDPSIATATMENGKIKVVSKQKGKTTIKVTDAAQKSAVLSVNVVYPFTSSTKQIDALVGEEITIDITSGNGGYTVSGSGDFNKYNNVRLSDDGAQIIITGKKAQEIFSYCDLSVTDQEGEKITIKVFTDYSFLTTTKSRIRFGGMLDNLDYYGMGGTPHGAATYQPLTDQSHIIVAVDLFGMVMYGGYGFTFAGKLTKGKKSNATLLQYEEGKVKAQFPVTNFEIVKIEGKTYWATFVYSTNNHFVITANF